MSQGYIHFESERHAQPELYVPWKVDLICRDLAETARIDANLWGAVDRVLKTLNASIRNCVERRSPARVFLNSENAHCGCVGSRMSPKRTFSVLKSFGGITAQA